MSSRRHLHLPRKGWVIVNTDLHGNGDDFRRLEQRFRERAARNSAVHWVILGDLVHGPNPAARARQPELYDFEDESAFIVRRVCELRRELPEHVHFVLGNHDYAHIGGPRTQKFYPDEAAHLEQRMSTEEIEHMHALFRGALLAVSTECGVMMSHGAPDATLQSLHDLEPIEIPPLGPHPYHDAILSSLLFAYGQTGAVTAALLEQLSSETMSVPLRVLLHGHDRAEDGFFREGGNQVCPVLFGARNAEKRYVELDLAGRYEHADDLRDGKEIRRLYAMDKA